MSKQPPYSVYAHATIDTYPDGAKVTIHKGVWTRLKCAIYLVLTKSFIVLGPRNINYPNKSRS